MAKLKQVLQTRKLNSLPSDLRLIAEDLILEKFGDDGVEPRKEKKVAKSTSSFRVYDEIGYFNGQIGIDMGRRGDEKSIVRLSNAFDESSLHAFTRSEPGVDRRIDYESRQHYYATPITRADTRSFRDAIQRLDYENVPNRDRKATVSPRFARELMSHPDFMQFEAYREDRYRGYNNGHYVASLFGVPIFVIEGVSPEIIAK